MWSLLTDNEHLTTFTLLNQYTHTEFQVSWNKLIWLSPQKLHENIHNLVTYQLYICHLLFPLSLIISSALLPVHLSFVFFIFILFPFIPLAFWSCCQRARTDSGGREKAFKFWKTERSEEISHIHNDRFHSYSGMSEWKKLQKFLLNYKEKRVSRLDSFGTNENIRPSKQGI